MKKRDNPLVLKKLSLGLHGGGAFRTYDLAFTGETSGNLGGSLGKLAEYFDNRRQSSEQLGPAKCSIAKAWRPVDFGPASRSPYIAK
ncbi:MAG TPA: hypothetical protein VMW72_11440 [Sedimentisphaerales bacterium]|nr:hypothetical protein [Sedimentisphaerales bacterium]